MKNLSQVFCENKRAQSLFRLKVAVSPLEQANGFAAEDLRPDFCDDVKHISSHA